MQLAQIKSALLLIVSFLFIQNTNCQRYLDSSNLIKFIQQNADSTIIYYDAIALIPLMPSYMIISKVGDRYIYASYADPYQQFSIAHNLPKGEIARKFRQESQAYNRSVPDTNKFFQPKIVPFPSQELIWKKITKLDPWKLKDDTDTTWKDRGKCDIYDGWAANIILITRDSYRHLAFYNPDFYEQCSPGNINRQKILKMEKIFESVFGAQ